MTSTRRSMYNIVHICSLYMYVQCSYMNMCLRVSQYKTSWGEKREWWNTKVGHIQILYFRKSRINAISASTKRLMEVIWNRTWTCMLGKGLTNVNSVEPVSHKQAIWEHTCKFILGKNQLPATNVTLPPRELLAWGHTWRNTMERNLKSVTSVVSQPLMHKP